jgi:hypothetical protein
VKVTETKHKKVSPRRNLKKGKEKMYSDIQDPAYNFFFGRSFLFNSALSALFLCEMRESFFCGSELPTAIEKESFQRGADNKRIS